VFLEDSQKQSKEVQAMTYGSGATTGAAAAANAQRRMFEEEEQMTHYSDDELRDDWEFKIVRATRGVFSKPDELKKLIGEEKQAGWILLEKFDNSRVRFKRRRSAQSNDVQLISSGIDPYRTRYGMSPGAYTILIIALTLVVMFGVMGLMMLFINIATRY
jgi:hypothetical protein